MRIQRHWVGIDLPWIYVAFHTVVIMSVRFARGAEAVRLRRTQRVGVAGRIEERDGPRNLEGEGRHEAGGRAVPAHLNVLTQLVVWWGTKDDDEARKGAWEGQNARKDAKNRQKSANLARALVEGDATLHALRDKLNEYTAKRLKASLRCAGQSREGQEKMKAVMERLDGKIRLYQTRMDTRLSELGAGSETTENAGDASTHGGRATAVALSGEQPRRDKVDERPSNRTADAQGRQQVTSTAELAEPASAGTTSSCPERASAAAVSDGVGQSNGLVGVDSVEAAEERARWAERLLKGGGAVRGKEDGSDAGDWAMARTIAKGLHGGVLASHGGDVNEAMYEAAAKYGGQERTGGDGKGRSGLRSEGKCSFCERSGGLAQRLLRGGYVQERVAVYASPFAPLLPGELCLGLLEHYASLADATESEWEVRLLVIGWNMSLVLFIERNCAWRRLVC